MDDAAEVWVPATRGVGYEVSSHGRVRGRKGWILRQPIRNGYPSVSIYTDKKAFTRENVHTLVLEAFVGPRPDGMHGCHNDGNKMHNWLTNLRWDSPKENAEDQYCHGTRVLGVRHHNAKLNPDAVREIRRRHKRGDGIIALARDYEVNPKTMASVIGNVTWRHIV